MSIPGQTFRILDPGLGLVPPAITTPLLLGCCSAGTVNQVYSLSRISDVTDQLGEGPLAEAVAQLLGTPGAGGPVLAIPMPHTTTGAIDSSTLDKTGGGTGTMTATGTPHDSYDVKVTITKAGAAGVGEFTYSLDGGLTTSPALPIPSGGTFPVPRTGISLVFSTASTTFAAGATYVTTCTAPHYTGADLAGAIDAAIDAAAQFAFVVAIGESATLSVQSGIATALGAQADLLFNRYQFVRAMTAAGEATTSATITEYASFQHARVLITYGQAAVGSRKPFTGWGFPTRPILDVVAARAASALISTDLGRVATGSVPNVRSIVHDEAANEVMDQKRFVTLRTYQGRPGYYITQGKLMSAPGSDFKYWQHGRCMDVACATAYAMQLSMLNDDVRTNEDGSIDDRDALRYEEPVLAALEANLTEPSAANGTPGHVSAVDYSIDRTNNVVGTDTLLTNVAIRPRGYVKNIVTQIGYTLNVGG